MSGRMLSGFLSLRFFHFCVLGLVLLICAVFAYSVFSTESRPSNLAPGDATEVELPTLVEVDDGAQGKLDHRRSWYRAQATLDPLSGGTR